MRLTKKSSFVCLAVVVMAVVVLLLARRSSPSYQGYSIKEWFYQAGDSGSRDNLDADEEAFRAMGSEALPFLIRRLENAPSTRTENLLSRVSPNFGTHYRQQKEMWQNRAAYLLGEIGPVAESTLPHLHAATNSPSWSVRGSTTVAIMKITGEPIEPLIEKLNNMSDYRSWYRDAMMVAAFGSRAEPAVPILLDALQHSNNIIQAHALIALGRIRCQPDRSVPAIVPFLTAPGVGIRQKAIGALLSFGTNAITAKAAIQDALNDPDPWVRNRAELAIEVLNRFEEEHSTSSQIGAEDPQESDPDE